MSRQLSIRDRELLSAFLDGQLDAKSTQQVEQAISARPEMKRLCRNFATTNPCSNKFRCKRASQLHP